MRCRTQATLITFANYSVALSGRQTISEQLQCLPQWLFQMCTVVTVHSEYYGSAWWDVLAHGSELCIFVLYASDEAEVIFDIRQSLANSGHL
jgi:hypothetical protein